MKERPLIKVCGMTDPEQVKQLAAMGVHYAGFIFYPASPRAVINKSHPAAIKGIKDILKVGVFVNAAAMEIQQAVEAYGLDLVQLHGDESPQFIKELDTSAKIIKAFRLQGDENIPELTQPFEENSSFFLFDTKAKKYGGTGKKFNWSVLQCGSLKKPWFLSGGIGWEDAGELRSFIAANEVHALDLNSRFEIAPGVKDLPLIQEFLDEL